MQTTDLGNGVAVSELEPAPAGDRLTAHHAALLRYGAMPLPADPVERRRWEWMLGQPMRYVRPEFELRDRRHPRTWDGTQKSDNWSGALVTSPDPTTEPVTSVAASWMVPLALPGPEGDTWYYCSSWVGIDNGQTGGADVIFQAGVESPVAVVNGEVQRSVYAWWEWLPAKEVTINLPVAVGDVVSVVLFSLPGTSEGVVFFFNASQLHWTGCVVHGSSSLEGAQADWIVERPTLQGPGGTKVLAPLADYLYVVFATCTATLGGKQALGLANATGVDMYDAHGDLMSLGTVNSASSVLCTWGGSLG